MDDDNQKTLEAYETGLDAYNASRVPTVTGSVKDWIDASLGMVPQSGKILELGSAHGRDADYIEACGFTIDRTDAAHSFVEYMKQDGKQARVLNALTDDFGKGFDMVYANAVLLHFTPEQSFTVIQKVYACLREDGVFAFSLKIGDGSAWSSAKLDAPRYFTYWNENDLKELILRTNFQLVFWEEGSTGHDNSDWYHVILKKS